MLLVMASVCLCQNLKVIPDPQQLWTWAAPLSLLLIKYGTCILVLFSYCLLGVLQPKCNYEKSAFGSLVVSLQLEKIENINCAWWCYTY